MSAAPYPNEPPHVVERVLGTEAASLSNSQHHFQHPSQRTILYISHYFYTCYTTYVIYANYT